MNYTELIFIIANLGIFVAYISIAFKRAIHIKALLTQTRWWGVTFFVTCGLTHLFMAMMTFFHWHLHDELPFWFVANHVIQLFAAWFFLQSSGVEANVTGHNNREFLK